jgi:hypothetical protein
LVVRSLAIITPSGAMRPDVTALGQVLDTIKQRPASRDLDAEVMEAMGWQVVRHSTHASLAWTMQSPMATVRQALPRVSTRTDRIAAMVLPFRWDWGVSEVGGIGSAWCSDGKPLADDMCPAYFEGAGFRTGALAFLYVALHAARSRGVDHKCSAPATFTAQLTLPATVSDAWHCRCDWVGPLDALHVGNRCPDCGTRALIGDNA